MKLPNWFKIVWWVALIVLLTVFLYHRLPDFNAGHAVAADIVVFLVWMALLLAPLFNEISLLGITLKQQIDELKTFVAAQVIDIRSEVRNANDIRTTISSHFHMGTQVSDAELPNMREQIKSAIFGAGTVLGDKSQLTTMSLNVPDNANILFAARYNIEVELRRLAESWRISNGLMPLRGYPLPVAQVAQQLVDLEVIEPAIADAIREVYSVCSPAIHGEPVTEAQISFVKELVPSLVATLRAISKRPKSRIPGA